MTSHPQHRSANIGDIVHYRFADKEQEGDRAGKTALCRPAIVLDTHDFGDRVGIVLDLNVFMKPSDPAFMIALQGFNTGVNFKPDTMHESGPVSDFGAEWHWPDNCPDRTTGKLLT